MAHLHQGTDDEEADDPGGRPGDRSVIPPRCPPVGYGQEDGQHGAQCQERGRDAQPGVGVQVRRHRPVAARQDDERDRTPQPDGAVGQASPFALLQRRGFEVRNHRCAGEGIDRHQKSEHDRSIGEGHCDQRNRSDGGPDEQQLATSSASIRPVTPAPGGDDLEQGRERQHQPDRGGLQPPPLEPRGQERQHDPQVSELGRIERGKYRPRTKVRSVSRRSTGLASHVD
jgi:hypothetical protein